MNNIILKTDSYKATHWKQYPKDTAKVYSYLESRGGMYDKTLFFGLQYILKKHLTTRVTREMVNDAYNFFEKHLSSESYFNYDGWMYIVDKLDGKLPVEIKAVPEGALVDTGNVLMTIENTDANCFWLTNYLETILMQVWYPITIATNSYYCKQIIQNYMNQTSDTPDDVNFKLHDFGYRGVSSYETAAIGGAAHLINFMGTDTIAGLELLREYYSGTVQGFSIPASEHSTITAWGKDKELEAMENMLKSYPTGLVACVSDSYDIYNACENLWGDKLKEQIINRDGCLVVRPDSGDPVEVTLKVINILWNQFGGSYNSKGYKVLHPNIRIIQGDGIDKAMIESILSTFQTNKFSADNIAFGSGGGLLQKFDRDTCKFAIKASNISRRIEGSHGYVYKDYSVWKNPITSPGKVSKRGRMKLHKAFSGLGDSKYMTITDQDSGFEGYKDELQTVYKDGKVYSDHTIGKIRGYNKS